jgi:hypothetical protein
VSGSEALVTDFSRRYQRIKNSRDRKNLDCSTYLVDVSLREKENITIYLLKTNNNNESGRTYSKE